MRGVLLLRLRARSHDARAISGRQTTAGSLHGVRGLLAAGVAVVSLLVVPAAHAFEPWFDEHALINSGQEGRETFIVDPGPGKLWTQAGLIAAHAETYRRHGFGNVLTW